MLFETYTLPTSQPFELRHQIAVGSDGSKTRLARGKTACTPCLQSLRAAKQLYLEDGTPFDLALVPEKDFLVTEVHGKGRVPLPLFQHARALLALWFEKALKIVRLSHLVKNKFSFLEKTTWTRGSAT